MRKDASQKRLLGLREMLGEMQVLEISAEVAEKFGQLQANHLDVGKPAPGMDLMIAATAHLYDLTLVTHNTQDFANFSDLRLVDWLVS